MFQALYVFAVVVVVLAGIAGALLLVYGARGLMMSDLVSHLRGRSGGSDEKKADQHQYGPVMAFDYRVDDKSDGPDNYPALVVEMEGNKIVAVSFMNNGLPFIVRQANKERVTFWKRFYGAYAAGRITQIKGFRPKLFGA